MTTVPTWALKNRFGKYLQLVREGEFVRVTRRGKPVAVIFPLKNSPTPAVEQLLKRAASRSGRASRFPKRPLRGRSLGSLLLQ